ncbi:Hypothetical protein NTJ_02370 [Nesidiocoris tenuis]|uniref:Uncharacterized protein n=1 Tax=Nesidiocoris tenuis TaxID=355587 RepID=A0ABN7AB87_9HEMI|nr:Hypothetical protein NTJ_02370 [Nesidiocoris tenuis]
MRGACARRTSITSEMDESERFAFVLPPGSPGRASMKENIACHGGETGRRLSYRGCRAASSQLKDDPMLTDDTRTGAVHQAAAK